MNYYDTREQIPAMRKLKFGRLLITFLALSLLTFGCNTSPEISPAQEGAQAAQPGQPQPDEDSLQILHYFVDTLGRKSMDEVIALFQKEHAEIKTAGEPMDHETFKVAIPSLLKGTAPPDVFSYWAGARVQAVVNSDGLQPISDLWAEQQLDQAFPPGIAAGATYNGEKYFIPIGYHYVAFFYNKKLFDTIGASPPQTWAELKSLAEQFKQAGIPAFALGSRERWPAQFWFDYLLLRTAGPAYRAELMAGKRAYTDPEVVRVMEMWRELIDAGYFYPDANAYDWAEAAETVARGQAAMTLMGTWITGYYKNELTLAPDKDYSYLGFPVVDEGVPMAALGPIDGFVMAKGARHPAEAYAFLTFLASPEPQVIWTLGQGALPPNVNVDPMIYDPLIQRVLKDVAAAETFAFNYDLATPPLMAEAGLEAFSEFMARPNDYMKILQKAESRRLELF
jgi:multiple sugar transport system substrate-binding protein/raffinose/stachyose/melibiose transport system substrate-binding protein